MIELCGFILVSGIGFNSTVNNTLINISTINAFEDRNGRSFIYLNGDSFYIKNSMKELVVLISNNKKHCEKGQEK